VIKHNKAQSTLEYATLIAVIVAAIVALNAYMRRGFEGHMRNAVDDIGTQYDIESGGYHSLSQIQGTDAEVTRSVFGKDENVIDATLPGSAGNIASIGGVETGEGVEVQWTHRAVNRTADETSTTNGDATINATGGGSS
jgi:uncharacterized protein (UPF0333 family)